MHWYLKVFKKYATFSGRADRKEYWMFVLFNSIIYVLLTFIDISINTGQFFTTIYSLVIFLPMIALTVRRLHDTNHSAWWMLINIIPIIGFIVMLVFAIKKGDIIDNEYGSNPQKT